MRRLTTIAAVLLGLCPAALAQTTYKLDPDAGWKPQDQAARDPERAAIDGARRLIAQGKFSDARTTLTDWIDAHQESDSPLLAEAYFLRGNAKLGQGKEYSALFDYEKVATKYPESPSFPHALEREFDVAVMYLNGLRKPSLGIRIDSGVQVAEEIILRIHERLPKSRLDEEAELALADFYYRDRDLKMAATAYDCFLINFPKSSLRERAMRRRTFATIAQFKGPNYDASGLVEAKYQVQEYQQEFPIQAEQNGMGDALQARLDESAAAQMLSVARWYLRHGDPASARITLSRLVQQHPATAASHEAIALMNQHKWLKPAQPTKTASTVPAAAATTWETGK